MEQIDLVRHAAAALDRLRLPYAVVGSWASGLYGEPRFTRDVDIVLDLPLFAVPAFCKAFPPSDFYLSVDAVTESVRTRGPFNALHTSTGGKIDFMPTRFEPWNAGQLVRRRRASFGSGDGAFFAEVAAPEDVILGKLWYYSLGGGERHLRDIAGVLRVTGDGVDRADVTRWAARLGYTEVWDQILAAVDAPDRPPGPGVP